MTGCLQVKRRTLWWVRRFFALSLSPASGNDVGAFSSIIAPQSNIVAPQSTSKAGQSMIIGL